MTNESKLDEKKRSGSRKSAGKSPFRSSQELHAHLNGSLSATTLQKLMDLKEGSRMKPDQVAVDTAAATIRAGHNKTIDEKVFSQ